MNVQPRQYENSFWEILKQYLEEAFDTDEERYKQLLIGRDYLQHQLSTLRLTQVITAVIVTVKLVYTHKLITHYKQRLGPAVTEEVERLHVSQTNPGGPPQTHQG